MKRRTAKSDPWRLDLGARLLGEAGARFRVWAPRAKTVSVQVLDHPGRDKAQVQVGVGGSGTRRAGGDVGPPPTQMDRQDLGYFEAEVAGVMEGTRYRYVLDGDKHRPDPASRFQPEGVHGPSAIVGPDSFAWTDQAWRGVPHKDLVIYELHTGTFTKQGTFPAIIPFLDYLTRDVGVTAIELMPIAQFPGARNWGYDGVAPFAPQASYGGPAALKHLVDACHDKGLAVLLDVVYNHLGPEGNYLNDFGPYFTDGYRTPWGAALNFDGAESDEVRHYFISNALYWISEYHIDGLRLDAVHGIHDRSARHFLAELAEAVHHEARRLGRTVPVIAESDLNDVRLVTPLTKGGYGLDAQWSDDFHHALHTLLTGERSGYYQDFGQLEQLATALRDGFVYSGQRSAFRQRRHGNASRQVPPARFVVSAQNHDQIGNRAQGERLSQLVPFDALKVAAASLLLSPNLPLLFMGEEYGETAPFLYFTDHGDPDLVEAVRKGRREEFASFQWQGEVPDPQAPESFEQSRVHPGRQADPQRAALLRWYHRLIGLRKSVPALGASEASARTLHVRSYEPQGVLAVHRREAGGSAALLVLGFNSTATALDLHEPNGTWALALDASAGEFGGAGASPAPKTLRLEGDRVTLALPAHAALIYVNERSGHG